MFIFEERPLGAVLAALAVAVLVGVAAPSITRPATPRATQTAAPDPTQRLLGQRPRTVAPTQWRN